MCTVCLGPAYLFVKKLQIRVALLLGISRLLLDDNLFLVALPLGLILGPLIVVVVVVIRGAKVGVVAKSLVTVCFLLARFGFYTGRKQLHSLFMALGRVRNSSVMPCKRRGQPTETL